MIPQNVCKMYENERLNRNEICRNCRLQAAKNFNWVSEPLGIWHVGEDFPNDDLRIVFVGKPHRGEPWSPDEDASYSSKNLLVQTDEYSYAIAENCAEWLFHNKKGPGKAAYWQYTREIMSRLYDKEESVWNKIAITNLVKCTVSRNNDRTPKSMKISCVKDLGIVWNS